MCVCVCLWREFGCLCLQMVRWMGIVRGSNNRGGDLHLCKFPIVTQRFKTTFAQHAHQCCLITSACGAHKQATLILYFSFVFIILIFLVHTCFAVEQRTKQTQWGNNIPILHSNKCYLLLMVSFCVITISNSSFSAPYSYTSGKR